MPVLNTQCSILSPNAVCPDLTDPANGMVVMAGNSVGNTATYSCDPGFELVGVQTVTCQADRTWSDPPPTCEPIGMKSPLYCRMIIMAVLYSRQHRSLPLILINTASQAMEIMNPRQAVVI